MHFVKTSASQQAFKERHADLSPRLRSAFLLFDGQRSLAQVLQAVAGMGVTQDEILALVEREWLAPRDAARSEEHTSELQSQSNLVCRLLLEKKKRTQTDTTAE